MFVGSVTLKNILVCLFWSHQVYSLNTVGGGVIADGYDNELVGTVHHSGQRKKHESRERYRSEIEREEYNLNLLEQFVQDSDRFIVLIIDDVQSLRCNWDIDLRTHDGSCGQFLHVEAGISVDYIDTREQNFIEIKFLSNDNDFSLFLSQLQSLLPMEWFVPIQLYDFRGPRRPNEELEESNASKYPPRFVIGNLQFPTSQSSNDADVSTATMDTTFDLGNSKLTILMVQDCRGCVQKEDPRNGCPDIVPTCEEEKTTKLTESLTQGLCWASHPNQSVPNHAFKYTKAACSHDSFYNKAVVDGPVCRQCFQNGDHSRFVVKARMTKFSLTKTTVQSTVYAEKENKVHRVQGSSPVISNFKFGALIRTVPLIDRIWSNVGIGAGSEFLTQLNVTRILFDFDYYNDNKNNNIVFNPSPMVYGNWEYARYRLKKIIGYEYKRIHSVHGFSFGHEDSYFSRKVHFHIDTGNDGISIADKKLQDFLADVTGGYWIKDTLYTPFSPDTAPVLNIDMKLRDKLVVNVPGSIWSLPKLSSEDLEEMKSVNSMLFQEAPSVYTQLVVSEKSPHVPRDYYPTIFNKYHKNVLGLPFLSLPGFKFLFDDNARALYIGRDD